MSDKEGKFANVKEVHKTSPWEHDEITAQIGGVTIEKRDTFGGSSVRQSTQVKVEGYREVMIGGEAGFGVQVHGRERISGSGKPAELARTIEEVTEKAIADGRFSVEEAQEVAAVVKHVLNEERKLHKPPHR